MSSIEFLNILLRRYIVKKNEHSIYDQSKFCYKVYDDLHRACIHWFRWPSPRFIDLDVINFLGIPMYIRYIKIGTYYLSNSLEFYDGSALSRSLVLHRCILFALSYIKKSYNISSEIGSSDIHLLQPLQVISFLDAAHAAHQLMSSALLIRENPHLL